MKAIILCGGKGERLRPLTENKPKPLVEINGKTILGYLLQWLSSSGIKDIYLTTGYLSSEIEKYVDLYSDINLNINYIDTGDCDIIDRLKSCEKFISDETLVMYGDTLADVNIGSLKILKKDFPKFDIMTAIQLKSSFGLFQIDKENNGYNFQEKPILDYWINIGYFVFRKETFSKMHKYKNFAEFLSNWTSQGKFKILNHDGVHITINTLSELENAKQELSKLGW